jgi:uroporphyrinogen-III decarboxylase
VHNILPDVPPENVVALFDAVSEWNDERSGGHATRSGT